MGGREGGLGRWRGGGSGLAGWLGGGEACAREGGGRTHAREGEKCMRIFVYHLFVQCKR